MIKQAEPHTAELTEYEAEQVKGIAAWKSEPPNPFSELFKLITMPGAKLAERLIPDHAVAVAIEKAYEMSEVLARQEDVKRMAGVHSLDELREKRLEECDRLAHRIGHTSEGIAAFEGVLTGAGGPFTTLLDIPLLFVLALRTIVKIGHCYGYALDRPKDRRFVLGILLVASSGSLERKQMTLGRLREVEEWLIEETQEELVGEELASMLFQLEIFEDIPGLGIVSGGLLNYAFIRKVESASQRVFQESWLRHNGKVDIVAPAPPTHHGVGSGRWAGALSRAVYSSCYYVGFGVALPAYFVSSAIATSNNALTRGIREGAVAANEGVDRLLARVRGEGETEQVPENARALASA